MGGNDAELTAGVRPAGTAFQRDGMLHMPSRYAMARACGVLLWQSLSMLLRAMG